MDGKYTRLKLKMLLLVVLGTVIAGAVGLFLLEVVVDGVLQDPFARFFLWAAENLFGQSEAAAAELYEVHIRGNKQEILTLATMALMLIAFYLAMGRFTRWLDDIRTATRQMVANHHRPVELPRELAPIQADLNAIQGQLRAREEASRESEQRRGDLVAFLAHDLKTPLTSVVGYLTLLRDDPGLTAEQRAKYTGIALDKARRLEELLGEFFDITRMGLEGEPGERQPIRLSMLLEQLTDEFYPRSRRRSSGAPWRSSTTWWCWGTRTSWPGSLTTCCATRSTTAPPAAGWTSTPARWAGRRRSPSATRAWRSPRGSWPTFFRSSTGWTPPAPPAPAGRGWVWPSPGRLWRATGAPSGRRATGGSPAL